MLALIGQAEECSAKKRHRLTTEPQIPNWIGKPHLQAIASTSLALVSLRGPHPCGAYSGAYMPQPVAERVKKLRDEIAAINQANRVYLHSPKYGSAVADHERRLQRLLEIVDELKSLTDWKKL